MTVPVATRGPSAGHRPAVRVLADLRLESDGQRAHLVGDGTALVLHTDNPMRFWSEINEAALPPGVGRVNGPRALGRAADVLADAGLTVDVTGPDGMLVRLGGATGSPFGRLSTGSSAVQFGSPRLLLSTLTAQLPVRRYAAAAAAIALAAGIFAALRRRR